MTISSHSNVSIFVVLVYYLQRTEEVYMLGKKLVLEKRYLEKKDLQFLDRKDMWA